MSRIEKLPPEQWDPALRKLFAADSATPLELGTMRMFAHCPNIARGIIALGAVWDVVEELPEAYRDRTAGPVTPWSGEPTVVR